MGYYYNTHDTYCLNNKNAGRCTCCVSAGGSLLLLILLILPLQTASAQQFGIKTNLLYLATTTPNIGAEWRTSSHFTLSTTVGYNGFNFPSNEDAEGAQRNPKLHHWIVMPEMKYWFRQAFTKSYLGLHSFYGRYNAGGIKFLPRLNKHRYRGLMTGCGISYGYQWVLGSCWGLEASAGVGYLYVKYDKHNCGSCGKKVAKGHQHRIAPTKAAVSIIYYIR